MSIENARAFYEKVKGDQSLQQKIGEQAKEKPAEMEAIIIKVAAENGFQFTLEEMRTVIAEVAPKGGELSDAELEAVAGGGLSKGSWIAASISTLGAVCLVAALTK
jgi:predicted ribosomally synthesized peptide with nif11-like leader